MQKMGIELHLGESAEQEFRKAVYKHKFDRAWLTEFYHLESDHYALMGAILEFTKPSTEDTLRENPLDSEQSSMELPWVGDVSEELRGMLGARYRALYGREPGEREIKH